MHTDGWLGYLPVEAAGYVHQVTFLHGKSESPSALMPPCSIAAGLATVASSYPPDRILHFFRIGSDE
jgi:hypothetical protein